MDLRITDIGDFRIMGKANTLSQQLRNIAARHSFINQSEEKMIKVSIHATFKSKSEAESFRDGMIRSYPPLGYGTTIKIWQEGDTWIASGFRYASCD